jgi:hypothetical protein
MEVTATITAARKAALASLPKAEEFAWPMLRAVHMLGGQATGRSIIEALAFEYMGLTAEQLAVWEAGRHAERGQQPGLVGHDIPELGEPGPERWTQKRDLEADEGGDRATRQ